MNALTMRPGQQFSPTPGGTRLLRDAMGKFTTGVTVVTCSSAQGPVCITANSFSSISLDPALVMWAADTQSQRYPFFAEADDFAIHVLASDQRELCTAASKEAFALRDIPHGENMAGVPLIDGCLARFECKRSACHEAGDHVIVVGQVLQIETREGAPLAFFSGKFGSFAP